MRGNVREDDFSKRREHLKNLNDEELKERFWMLTSKIVDPLLDLAKKNTSPAIERSVLLRMGFSSIEAKTIVNKVIDYNLIGKGAGHVVYRLAKINDIEIREAGLMLLNDKGWEEVKASFLGGVK